MAVFAYVGRTRAGQRTSGQMEAANAAGVALRLEQDDITALSITTGRERANEVGQRLRRWRERPPTTMDMILFTRQMLSITKSGMPLLRGLRSLVATTRNARLQRALNEVVIKLESGHTLAGSMALHPDVFPELYTNMIKVGEEAGSLETVFERLGDFLGAAQNLRDRVAGATRYPLIVIGAIVVAIGVLTIFVIPKFQPIFRSLGAQLPLPTKILLGLSSFAVNHGILLLVLTFMAICAIRWWLASPAGRLRWDEWKLRIPVFGQLNAEALLARAMSTLSLTLSAGVPMLQALALIARSTGNSFMCGKVQAMREAVQRGDNFSDAASHSRVMPPLVVQMIATGEETGELTRLLDDVASYYEREVDYALKNLTAMIEPLLIVMVGGMILILALGIFLPLWDMMGKMAAT
jgi:MSHA biogenesis protein MshG